MLHSAAYGEECFQPRDDVTPHNIFSIRDSRYVRDMWIHKFTTSMCKFTNYVFCASTIHENSQCVNSQILQCATGRDVWIHKFLLRVVCEKSVNSQIFIAWIYFTNLLLLLASTGSTWEFTTCEFANCSQNAFQPGYV